MDTSIISEIIAALILISIISMLWYFFSKYASPRIRIEINNGTIRFNTDRSQISLKAYLFISKTNKRYRILSVGEEPNSNELSIKVDLFQSDVEGIKEYHECLAAFFRHGFSKVVGRRALVVPKVTIKGAEKIYTKVDGVTPKSFCKAMRHAGAIQCDFR